MAFSTTALNAAVDAIRSAATHVSLHTGDPSTTGANEASGGGYARVAENYTAASSGASDLAAALDFSIEGGDEITHYGVWTASTSGTFLCGGALTDPVEISVDGTLRLTSAPISAA